MRRGNRTKNRHKKNTSSAPKPTPRPPGGAVRALRLTALLLLAFAVKAVVLAQLGGHPLLQPHGELDTAQYIELARKVASGGLLAITEPFFVSPLYVYFLAAVFSLGGSIMTARTVQILLGTAAVGLVFLTARHELGERAGWFAGALAALTGLFTFYEILILQAALDPFLVAAALYLIARARADERGWYPAAAGAVTGLLALNRPNALAYGIVAAVWLAFRSVRGAPASARWKGIGRAMVFPACLLFVLVPNTLRNWAVSGEWIPVSSHGGLNFYIGNHPEADGIYSRVEGITPSIASQSRDAARLAEAGVGRALSAGEVSDYFYRRAWDWIAGHPVEAARLFAWKVLLVLNRTNVPLNHSYAYFRQEAASILRWLAVGPWLLVPLGLVGLFLSSARRVQSGYWVWASFIPVYGLSVAAFFVSSRYRMPLLVPLAVTSAGAFAWGLEQVRSRRLRALAAPAVALAALSVVANWPLGLDDGRSFEQTRWAVRLIEQGRQPEAQEYVARVAPYHTQPGVLHHRVGKALADGGHFHEAVEHLREALAIDGGRPALELDLGQSLTITGRPDEALPHLTAAFEAGYRPEVSGPWLVRALAAVGDTERTAALLATLPDGVAASRPDTALDLGTAALVLQAPALAERWLRLAAEDPAPPAGAYEKLGSALLLLDRVEEAAASLETACRVDPLNAAAHLNLGVAYARLGRLDDAQAQAEEALRLDPAEPRAAAFLKALNSNVRATRRER